MAKAGTIDVRRKNDLNDLNSWSAFATSKWDSKILQKALPLANTRYYERMLPTTNAFNRWSRFWWNLKTNKKSKFENWTQESNSAVTHSHICNSYGHRLINGLELKYVITWRRPARSFCTERQWFRWFQSKRLFSSGNCLNPKIPSVFQEVFEFDLWNFSCQ